MQPKLTIQERLKDLRVERSLTLEQLSAETGISKSALGKYEADDFKDISPFSMVELAKFYGVSTDYLLCRTEQKNHPNTELDALHLSDDAVDVSRDGQAQPSTTFRIYLSQGLSAGLCWTPRFTLTGSRI